MSTETDARKRLLRDHNAHANLRSLIKEYDRARKLLAMYEERGLGAHTMSRAEGEIAGISMALAVFAGTYALPVGDERHGVEGWMPALRRLAA